MSRLKGEAWLPTMKAHNMPWMGYSSPQDALENASQDELHIMRKKWDVDNRPRRPTNVVSQEQQRPKLTITQPPSDIPSQQDKVSSPSLEEKKFTKRFIEPKITKTRTWQRYTAYFMLPNAQNVLPDGCVFKLRPLIPGDAERLSWGLRHLSDTSRIMRFLTPVQRFSEPQTKYLTQLDYVSHFAWGICVVKVSSCTPSYIHESLHDAVESVVTKMSDSNETADIISKDGTQQSNASINTDNQFNNETSPTGSNAPGLNAPGLNAPGLNAPGLNAPAFNAPAFNVRDSPVLDAPVVNVSNVAAECHQKGCTTEEELVHAGVAVARYVCVDETVTQAVLQGYDPTTVSAASEHSEHETNESPIRLEETCDTLSDTDAASLRALCMSEHNPTPRSPVAEVAITVVDNFHQLGLATLLMWAISESACRRGIRKLVGICHRENQKILSFMHKLNGGGDIPAHEIEGMRYYEMGSLPLPFPSENYKIAAVSPEMRRAIRNAAAGEGEIF